MAVERAVRKGQQPPWMAPDGLRERIEPLLPVVPRRADHPGRKRLDDRKVLSGILFVLYGVPVVQAKDPTDMHLSCVDVETGIAR